MQLCVLGFIVTPTNGILIKAAITQSILRQNAESRKIRKLESETPVKLYRYLPDILPIHRRWPMTSRSHRLCPITML